MLRKLGVEFIGTFFLVLTIGLVALEPGAGAFAPLAVGSVLMVMVYAGGHVSGAHYNPAVTLAVWLRGLAAPREVLGYVVTQLLAAVAAACVIMGFKEDVVATLPIETGPAFMAELLFTFALAWVVLNVATAHGTKGNSYFGIAIGFTVMAGAYAVGVVSGAAFNPAVTTAMVVIRVLDPGTLWVYFVSQLLGAAAAAMLFRWFVLAIDKPTDATLADQAGLEPAASTGAPDVPGRI